LKSRRAEGNGMDLQEHRLYVGPIPSPDIIKEFSEIDPSFPERLMALGEREAKHRQREVELNNKVVRQEIRSDAIVRFVSPFMAFIVVVAVLYLAYFAFSKGLEWGGTIIALPGLALVVGMFVRFTHNRRSK
jgi:uncharacterized membrane protein